MNLKNPQNSELKVFLMLGSNPSSSANQALSDSERAFLLLKSNVQTYPLFV